MINEDLRKWFREKWVRLDTKGNIKGECARGEGEGKPKCLPLAKARAMSKEDRAKATKRKRRKDPVADRKGKGEKPVFVATEELILEKNVPTNPTLWSKAKSLAKQKFDVYPSAYANGWAAKWYKSKGGKWKSMANEEKTSKKNVKITDTTMPTADRSISGGSKGIIESDENVTTSNKWKDLHAAVKRQMETGTFSAASSRVGEKSTPPKKMRGLVPANESVEHIDEARKALGKMAHTPSKPRKVKISYTAPAKHPSPKTPRKKREWNYNDEVKKLRSKFVKDIKQYKDPILRKRIKDDYVKELKNLKSIARVHKGKHPDTFFKRILNKIGIHTEEYGAGEQGTPELTNNYKNMTPGQECSTTSKTAKIVKKVVSEAARRYDPVAGYRRGRPFRGGRRFKARTSGKSRQVDASRPTRTAGMLRRKMNRKAQKAMKRTMTVTARGT